VKEVGLRVEIGLVYICESYRKKIKVVHFYGPRCSDGVQKTILKHLTTWFGRKANIHYGVSSRYDV